MDAATEAHALQRNARWPSWRGGLGHAGRILLGAIFLFSGIAKGLTPSEFTQQVAGYGILGPRLTALAAPALIVFEIVLGVALVCAVRPVLTAGASIVLLLIFIGIEAYGLSAGRTEACGCFGAYSSRTPAEVIGEDLLFVLLGAIAIWGSRGWEGLRAGGAGAVLVASLLISTAFVVASPSLPFFNIPVITRLAPGAVLADLKLEKRLPALAEGRHLVALFDVTDARAAGIAEALNALAATQGAPPILGLTPSTEQEIDAFLWTAVPAFEVKRIDREVIPVLYRRLPRFFLVDSGRVTAVYDGAPPEAKDLL
ncbi:MAG TPA: MauE/DoxX family redox-associated membrane protein [Candidatus Dormibacteraeota bacterium]|nr:MauE/DoxX family redox-associated membrane protein [Candidatus Dormibacteraeota bacterium]